MAVYAVRRPGMIALNRRVRQVQTLGTGVSLIDTNILYGPIFYLFELRELVGSTQVIYLTWPRIRRPSPPSRTQERIQPQFRVSALKFHRGILFIPSIVQQES